MPADSGLALATAIVHECTARGWTLATGESVTAGLVSAAIADVPGASAVLAGGVVAYDARIKGEVLGVPSHEIAAGLVTQGVAVGLARGARGVLGTTLGIGVTGVAGPDSHGGEPVGSVWAAVCGPERELARHVQLAGDRAAIRAGAVQACLELVAEYLGLTAR